MNHKFCLIYSWFVWLVTFLLPDIPFIMKFRGWLYSIFMKKAGKNFQVASNVKLIGLNNISVGDNVYLAWNVVLNATTDIVLHNDVMVGIGSILVSGNHTMLNGSFRFGQPKRSPIVIGAGSWLAGNVLVTAGSVLPQSSVVAGGSVLNKAFTESGVYAGLPAALVKKN